MVMVVRRKIFFNKSPIMNFMHRITLTALKTKYCHFNYLNELTFTILRPFKTSQHVLSEKKFNLDHSKLVKKDGTVVRKKTIQEKLITLVHNSTNKVLKLSEAIKLAEHEKLYLVKIKKPTPKSMDFYQLSNVPELSSEKNTKMKMKTFTMRTTIANHDLLIKIRGLVNALNKYKIGCYVIESNSKDSERIDELSKKVQEVLKHEGIDFKVKHTKMSALMRTVVVEVKEDAPVVNNVEQPQNDKGSDQSQETNKS